MGKGLFGFEGCDVRRGVVAPSSRVAFRRAIAASIIAVCLNFGGAGVGASPPWTSLEPGASPDPALWREVRADLINEFFGLGRGVLPTRSVPDYVSSIPAPQVKGCYCAYFGHCDANDCQWSNNMTKIVWTIPVKVNDTYTLTLNSTVFHTLNTSGVAPQIYPPVGPVAMPGGGWYENVTSTSPSHAPQKRSDTLVIFHHGHSQPCDQCWIPLD